MTSGLVGSATRAIINRVRSYDGFGGLNFNEKVISRGEGWRRGYNCRLFSNASQPFRTSDAILMTQADIAQDSGHDYFKLIREARAGDKFAITLLRLCEGRTPVFKNIEEAGAILSASVNVAGPNKPAKNITIEYFVLKNTPRTRAILAFMRINFKEEAGNNIAIHDKSFECLTARTNARLFARGIEFSSAPIDIEDRLAAFDLSDSTSWLFVSKQLQEKLQADLRGLGVFWFKKSPFGQNNVGPFFNVESWQSQPNLGYLSEECGGTVLRLIR